MNLVFLGKQGVGKGTYAQRVLARYNLVQISTGDLLREEIKSNSALGKKLSEIVNAGQLVSDDIVTQMLETRLSNSDCENGFILDGYPRTLTQAQLLDGLLAKLNKTLDLVVLFWADDAILLDRITGRIQCRICGKIYHTTNLKPKVAGRCDLDNGELYQREDDKKEAILKRWETFESQTKPIVAFYESEHKLFKVNAGGDIDSILKSLYSKLDSMPAEEKNE